MDVPTRLRVVLLFGCGRMPPYASSRRIELLSDDEQQVGRVLKLYRDLIADRITAGEVWKQLQASNRVGVTRGTLEERRNPLAIL